MATDKKGISVYVSDDVLNNLERWKEENKVRASSAAIEQILKQFFDLGTGDYLTRTELDPIVGKLQAWMSN